MSQQNRWGDVVTRLEELARKQEEAHALTLQHSDAIRAVTLTVESMSQTLQQLLGERDDSQRKVRALAPAAAPAAAAAGAAARHTLRDRVMACAGRIDSRELTQLLKSVTDETFAEIDDASSADHDTRGLALTYIFQSIQDFKGIYRNQNNLIVINELHRAIVNVNALGPHEYGAPYNISKSDLGELEQYFHQLLL